jgi:hypothetical protein
MRSISRQDVPIVIDGEGVEVRMREEGDLTVSFVRLPAGANLAPALKGLPGGLCPCPHWGYMPKGRLRMRTKDGPRDFEAGQPFYWSPGHAPEALEDADYVDFSPTDQFQHLIDHLTQGTAQDAT